MLADRVAFERADRYGIEIVERAKEAEDLWRFKESVS